MDVGINFKRRKNKMKRQIKNDLWVLIEVFLLYLIPMYILNIYLHYPITSFEFKLVDYLWKYADILEYSFFVTFLVIWICLAIIGGLVTLKIFHKAKNKKKFWTRFTVFIILFYLAAIIASLRFLES